MIASLKSGKFFVVLTTALVAGLVGLGAAPATASSSAPSQEVPPTTSQIEAARTALNESDEVSHTTVVEDGVTSDVYETSDGIVLSLARPQATEPGTYTRFLSAGSNSSGTYIAFNHTDQLAIKNVGTASVIAAICLIGAPVCVIAGIIGAGAGTYISANGFCPGDEVLRAYYEAGIDGNANITRYSCVQPYAGA